MQNNEPFPAMHPEWSQAVAALVETISTDRFPGALRQVLALCCDFDSMIVFHHDGEKPPIAYYQDLDELRAAISVEFYASGPYLLDPLYLARQNGCEQGAYRLLDLAPEAFYRSEYYKTFFRKIRISDEIGVLISDGTNRWFTLSIACFARGQKFELADTARLNAVFDVLSASIRRNWGQVQAVDPELENRDLENRMLSFGTGALSPREQDVVQLVLQGHSTPSAAAYLGIAEGTVKVHRHHAYSKLGISSQAQLFSLASRHLAGQGSN